MKNKIKLIGIIAIVAIVGLALMSCGGKKGGSVEVTNNTGFEIQVKIIEGKDKNHGDWGEGNGTSIGAAVGTTGTVSISADGDHTLIWRTTTHWGAKNISLSGEQEKKETISTLPSAR